jgi:photosystem II stability/assembly factor-like uncharacterized protein
MNIRINLLALVMLLMFLFASCKKEKLEWQAVEKLESHTTDRLNSILFVNDTLGYAVGGERFHRATILITRNGGATWTKKDFPEAGKGLYGLTQKYTGETVAIGFEGKTLTTGDGENWTFNTLNSWEPYKDLEFIEPATGIGIVGISFNYGAMAYFDEKYAIYRYDTFEYELNDIEMLNNRVGYISGYGVVMKTTDGAVKWHLQEINNDNFTAIHAFSENELWVCGYNGSVCHTTDGGASWHRLRSGNDIKKARYRLLDIVFKDQFSGWAVGEEGVVIHTTDGGKKWELYKKFTDQTLRSIVLAPGGYLMVAGDGGSLYRLKAQ